MTALRWPRPTLGDGRIVLRRWLPGDAAALAAAWHDPLVLRWTAVPADRSEVAARRWIAWSPQLVARGLSLDLVVADAQDRVLGEVGLTGFSEGSADIGFWVGPTWRGEGVATRAVRLVTAWATRNRAGFRLRGEVASGNLGSQRVLHAAGYHQDSGHPGCWVSD